MTRKQLFSALKKHDFLLLRDLQGDRYGVNCKVGKMKRNEHYEHSDALTNFISYRPVNFNEYISTKMPFMTTPT